MFNGGRISAQIVYDLLCVMGDLVTEKTLIERGFTSCKLPLKYRFSNLLNSYNSTCRVYENDFLRIIQNENNKTSTKIIYTFSNEVIYNDNSDIKVKTLDDLLTLYNRKYKIDMLLTL